ncbi:PepSY-associated TM helix domain-containing protein [Mucilaginibacter auburnensis]|uniref:Putative iron-regulated membrane protein n=1 Tax=Mucilaginibacter auburnensis TaxID=1457233 RepID=A0A2H9VTM8_9SPHI|nr:PepSY-associated TM helix domain-containing protein [Mucilaginibacter auburnensis]PJJ84149.1 putative iron-regulated membrane protein [Mucilaginibacter auburnensis]
MLSTTPRASSGSKKSVFRKMSEWLHLWLGLFSGIIVFVVCLTGGIWVFRYEVWHFTEPYQRVEVQQKNYLQPSELVERSRRYLASKGENPDTLASLTLGKAGKSAFCIFDLGGESHAYIYLNPYTGQILHDKREASPAEAFFIFVRAGHRFFWLPQKIGSPVVGSACIIFIITLLTGLIWWFPLKWTKKTRDKSFKIKWNANWKRVNIDLHNVVGFYALLFIMTLTISGVVFTFDWFENGLYRSLTFRGLPETKQANPFSDTTLATQSRKFVKVEDKIINQLVAEHPNFGRIQLVMPGKKEQPYQATVFSGDGTIIYDRDVRYYDQYTLKSLPPTNPILTPYAQASAGEKLFRMNFDIHTGQILGLPTKIIAFFACIIGASLPITGFIIWYNRKWGKKKTAKRKKRLAKPNLQTV